MEIVEIKKFKTEHKRERTHKNTKNKTAQVDGKIKYRRRSLIRRPHHYTEAGRDVEKLLRQPGVSAKLVNHEHRHLE